MLNADLVIVIAASVFTLLQIVFHFIKKTSDTTLQKTITESHTALLASINALVTKIDTKFDENDKKINTIKETVDKTWQLHDHYDVDGLPSWYVPRSWSVTQEKIIQTQEKMLEVLREIAHTQSVTAKTIERIEEKHSNKK